MRSFSRTTTVVLGVAALMPAVTAARSEGSAPAVSWRGDLETGDISQWTTLQHEFDRPVAESFEIVRSPVRQGAYAAKFTLRQGYGPFGYNESVELIAGHVDESEGDERWYRWSTLFPPGWRAPYGWGVFFQIYPRRSDIFFIGCPPILFHVRQQTAHVVICTGNIDGEVEYRRTVPLLSTLSPGLWNDFLVHVRYATDRSGIFEVWHRVEGERAFVKKISRHGIPTLQWKRGHGPARVMLKQGLYRKSYCGPSRQDIRPGCPGHWVPGIQPENVLYHDATARASTVAGVAVPLLLADRPRLLAGRLLVRAYAAPRRPVLVTVRDAGGKRLGLVRVRADAAGAVRARVPLAGQPRRQPIDIVVTTGRGRGELCQRARVHLRGGTHSVAPCS